MPDSNLGILLLAICEFVKFRYNIARVLTTIFQTDAENYHLLYLTVCIATAVGCRSASSYKSTGFHARTPESEMDGTRILTGGLKNGSNGKNRKGRTGL